MWDYSAVIERQVPGLQGPLPEQEPEPLRAQEQGPELQREQEPERELQREQEPELRPRAAG